MQSRKFIFLGLFLLFLFSATAQEEPYIDERTYSEEPAYQEPYHKPTYDEQAYEEKYFPQYVDESNYHEMPVEDPSIDQPAYSEYPVEPTLPEVSKEIGTFYNENTPKISEKE
ncbi:MAG: hypothetical protein QW331_00430 [Candidatus Woesearchaeota archaeon]